MRYICVRNNNNMITQEITRRIENDEQANDLMRLAFGRILKLGSRSTQPEDMEEYAKAKSIFIAAADYLGMNTDGITL